MATATLQKWTLTAGQVVARYSVVFFFLAFGLMKFTPAEAAAIHPLLSHSPFLFWLPRLFDQQLSSDIVGVVEIALAVMMASRPFTPRISAIGSYGVAASLVVTLSFLVTTPQLDPALGVHRQGSDPSRGRTLVRGRGPAGYRAAARAPNDAGLTSPSHPPPPGALTPAPDT